MGFLSGLRKRKKDNEPIAQDAPVSTEILIDDTVSEWDFQYSQSIFNRNLTGIAIYEIEIESAEGDTLHKEQYAGECIEMSEGRMVLGIRTNIDNENPFENHSGLRLSYSMHGESFYVEAKAIKVTGSNKDVLTAHPREGEDTADAGMDGEQLKNRKYYIIEAILCEEPVRHRRLHGRVFIDWSVYYRVKEDVKVDDTEEAEDHKYSVTKTVDISEGGFKGIIEEQLEKNILLECIVEVDNFSKSKGTLVGKVIRCDHMIDSIEMYELTVQFIEMDDLVKSFLAKSIEREHPGAIDAEAKITITGEGFEALIELSPPRNNGRDLSYEGLCGRVASEGITYGIDYELLESLSDKPIYNLESVVARGLQPIDGADTELVYHVEMNPVLAPKENEDGTVDFKDLGLIQSIGKDDILVEKIFSTEGTDGVRVTGELAAAKPGKDKRLPAGENTVVNEEGTVLSAGIDGCISIVDDKINVFSTYVVDGDVQYETGNITHNGIVIVKGDVRYGFTVEASGDIVINGTVESATIAAGGSLVVQGGCVGEENVIETGGDMVAKFVDGGSFTIKGNIKTTYIINSKVRCSGSIEMIGSGIIRNSHVVAQTAIKAKSIGSEREAVDKTVVEVGNDPELLNRFLAITKKLEKLDKDVESFEAAIRGLTLKKYKNELSEEKLKVLEKSKALVKQFSVQHEELTDERDAMQEQINKLGYGTIHVQNTAFEGLRIIIGSSTLILKDSIKAAKFIRNDEGITFTSLK